MTILPITIVTFVFTFLALTEWGFKCHGQSLRRLALLTKPNNNWNHGQRVSDAPAWKQDAERALNEATVFADLSMSYMPANAFPSSFSYSSPSSTATFAASFSYPPESTVGAFSFSYPAESVPADSVGSGTGGDNGGVSGSPDSGTGGDNGEKQEPQGEGGTQPTSGPSSSNTEGNDETVPIDGDTKVDSTSKTNGGGDVFQPVSEAKSGKGGLSTGLLAGLILAAIVLAAAMALMLRKYARSHLHDLSVSSASGSGSSVSTGNVA